MVYMGCQKDQKTIGVVPWGSPGGSAWDDGIYDEVREISLIYGDCIDTIQVTYEKNCSLIVGQKHGTNKGEHAGNKTATINMEPGEFLRGVTGHYTFLEHLATQVVRSLMFKTNKKTFGPYGVQKGTPFSFEMEGGKIVGFKGRSSWYLDAIGFHIVSA